MANPSIYEGDDKDFTITVLDGSVGVAQDAGTSTITLKALDSDVDDFYNGYTIEMSDTGERNTVTDYSGSTKIATVTNAWVNVPTSVSGYTLSTPRDITGHTLLFTVKSKINDSDADAIISKDITTHSDPTNGITSVTIDRADTLGVRAGLYPYDVKDCDAGTLRATVAEGTFKIIQSVGDREC